MQTEYSKVDGGNNGELENEPQDAPEGDEVITLRYDFFEYVGPYDDESYEAKCEKVGPDDLHGEGIDEGTGTDFSTVVVGDYIGAQMAGFDVGGQIGLIDHLQDGTLDEPYVDRRIVIAGAPPIATTREGELPQGMAFDEIEGILSGTPAESGDFSFTVHSTDSAGGDVTREYTLRIVDGAVIGEGEGVPEGMPEGILEGGVEGVAEGVVEGSLEGISEGILEGSVEGVAEGSLEGEGDPCARGGIHSADTSGNRRIELAELLRVIQFFNSARFGCGNGSDGYAANSSDSACCVHNSDFDPRDWHIGLRELLRLIQFFNSGGYHSGTDTDGFAPGA